MKGQNAEARGSVIRERGAAMISQPIQFDNQLVDKNGKATPGTSIPPTLSTRVFSFVCLRVVPEKACLVRAAGSLVEIGSHPFIL